MTSSQRAIVIVLAVLSALCEIAGTVTVLITYLRSARLGEHIRKVITSGRDLDTASWADPNERLQTQMRRHPDISELQISKKEYRDTLESLAEPLQLTGLASAGLIAYIAGALFGLAAAVVAAA